MEYFIDSDRVLYLFDIVAYAAIASNGKFSDDYFIAGSEKLTKMPDFEKINNILSDISASALHYRRERKIINSSGSFKYHPILMYPLIKPWSNYRPQNGLRIFTTWFEKKKSIFRFCWV